MAKNPIKLKKTIQKLFVFAFTWAFGGTLQREDEHEDDIIFIQVLNLIHLQK